MSDVFKYIIGVDEAGRGPLAGPVTVGAVCLETSILTEIEESVFPKGIRDSKKITAKRRAEIFAQLAEWHKVGKIVIAHTHAPASDIDGRGIAVAIKKAVAKTLLPFGVWAEVAEVRLDGALKAPASFLNQQTIIRGDESELTIALASVVAKVLRDELMTEADNNYPVYGFAGHKGYGTKAHFLALDQNGLCPLHRRSFLTKYNKRARNLDG